MPKSKDRDFFVNARRVVEQAIGETMDGMPLNSADAGKDPKAVLRGRSGGIKGGPARAAKLTPIERKKIAVIAANKRWGRPTRKKD